MTGYFVMYFLVKYKTAYIQKHVLSQAYITVDIYSIQIPIVTENKLYELHLLVNKNHKTNVSSPNKLMERDVAPW